MESDLEGGRSRFQRLRLPPKDEIRRAVENLGSKDDFLARHILPLALCQFHGHQPTFDAHELYHTIWPSALDDIKRRDNKAYAAWQRRRELAMPKEVFLCFFLGMPGVGEREWRRLQLLKKQPSETLPICARSTSWTPPHPLSLSEPPVCSQGPISLAATLRPEVAPAAEQGRPLARTSRGPSPSRPASPSNTYVPPPFGAPSGCRPRCGKLSACCGRPKRDP